MQGFCGWEGGWGKKLLTKEKGCFRMITFPLGEGRVSNGAHYLLLLWSRERLHVADDLIDAGQKIPDLPVKTTFLGEVETAVRLGVQSRLGDLA